MRIEETIARRDWRWALLLTFAALAGVVLAVAGPATGSSGAGMLDTRYAGDAAANESELVDTRFWAEAWGDEGLLDTKTPVSTILILR